MKYFFLKNFHLSQNSPEFMTPVHTNFSEKNGWSFWKIHVGLIDEVTDGSYISKIIFSRVKSEASTSGFIHTPVLST